jgi:peptidoglycan/LPS O-acetylase OafA/YrhL
MAEKQHIFDNPRNVKRVIGLLIVCCAVLFVADFFVHRHVDHPWESLFGFYAVYGFVACVILVLAAKEMRKVVMRKEDYYDDR